MMYCLHTPVVEVKWIDKRRAYLQSYHEGRLCEECVNALEAHEDAEIIQCKEYSPAE